MRPRQTLLFVGDSLIEYFDWQERFPGHKVINLGISGETVEGLLSRRDVVIQQAEDPDRIFIMTGINNIAMGFLDLAVSYRKVIDGLKRAFPHAEIVVHSMLPVIFPWISNEEIRRSNEGIRVVARETGATYLDIHPLFLGPEGAPIKACLLDDGVHLSSEGYRLWSAEVEKLIR